MSDYIKDLEKFETKIIELLTNQTQEMNLTALIKKAKETGISKSSATLRDAIMSAGAKKKLRIEAVKPKQLFVRLPERR